MDQAILTALQSYEVGFYLLPLPKVSLRDESSSSAAGSQQTFKQYGKETYDKWQWHPYGKGKGKGKGKQGKGKGKNSFIPKQLQGRDNVSSDPHGRRLCFDYNLKKCSGAADGAQCQSGWHLCVRRGGQAPRPEADHDRPKTS